MKSPTATAVLFSLSILSGFTPCILKLSCQVHLHFVSSLMMMDTCFIHLPRAMEGTTPRMNPDTNYELRVVMTCQCRFIDCDKMCSLVGEAVYVWGWEVHEKSFYLPLIFAVTLKQL